MRIVAVTDAEADLIALGLRIYGMRFLVQRGDTMAAQRLADLADRFAPVGPRLATVDGVPVERGIIPKPRPAPPPSGGDAA